MVGFSKYEDLQMPIGHCKVVDLVLVGTEILASVVEFVKKEGSDLRNRVESKGIERHGEAWRGIQWCTQSYRAERGMDSHYGNGLGEEID
jgi:hypothetical protein